MNDQDTFYTAWFNAGEPRERVALENWALRTLRDAVPAEPMAAGLAVAAARAEQAKERAMILSAIHTFLARLADTLDDAYRFQEFDGTLVARIPDRVAFDLAKQARELAASLNEQAPRLHIPSEAEAQALLERIATMRPVEMWTATTPLPPAPGGRGSLPPAEALVQALSSDIYDYDTIHALAKTLAPLQREILEANARALVLGAKWYEVEVAERVEKALVAWKEKVWAECNQGQQPSFEEWELFWAVKDALDGGQRAFVARRLAPDARDLSGDWHWHTVDLPTDDPLAVRALRAFMQASREPDDEATLLAASRQAIQERLSREGPRTIIEHLEEDVMRASLERGDRIALEAIKPETGRPSGLVGWRRYGNLASPSIQIGSTLYAPPDYDVRVSADGSDIAVRARRAEEPSLEGDLGETTLSSVHCEYADVLGAHADQSQARQVEEPPLDSDSEAPGQTWRDREPLL